MKNQKLTSEEKTYIAAIIKPLRDKITSVSKYTLSYDNDYLEMVINDNGEETYWQIPIYENFMSYKGLEFNKEYTLEELGL